MKDSDVRLSAKLAKQQLLGFHRVSTPTGGSYLARQNSAKIGGPPVLPPPPPKIKIERRDPSSEQSEE